MSRELKFRGQKSNSNDWVCGGLINDQDKAYINQINCPIWVNYLPKEDESYHKQIRLIVFDVQTETVGQFTGFKDKNGKEIYEGDIVTQWIEDIVETTGGFFWNATIEFYHGCWVAKQIGFDYERAKEFPTILNDESSSSEIVGNIYENPELLSV